jgi:anaphase-promoting complex subunit 6
LEYLYDLNAMQMNDEEALMSNLSFKQCSVEEELITKYLYQHKLHHSKIFNSSKKPLTLPDQCQPLTKSLDVQSHIASNFLQMMNIKECYKITQNILKQDPYHLPTIIIFIACCVINNSTKDLYRLGQEMVKCFPELALSWYAVSCYYYSLGKHVMTRRYLTKAINLDPHFSHAHFAFGLSFASEGEHDQAIAAFSHAARYLKTSYLPLMYLGKEYSITGNLPIAISFFKNAQILAPNNATLLQEIGIVLANSGHYSKARVYFEKAAAILQKVDPHVTLPMWEPVYNNLGHILRKEGNYAGALDAHYKALQLIPNEPSTLSCIAFVYILMEDYENVIHYCNQSLRLRREDRFTIELLSHAVNELAGAEVDLTLKPSMNSSDLDKMIYEN